MLTIYNTQTRRKEEFKPLNPDRVTMYACGPTVYDLFHIGNARSFVVFDMARRYLNYRGYNTTMVQNFTDVDDKMIGRATREGTSVQELGQRFIKEYKQDAEALGIKAADVHPVATEHIDDMVKLISELIEKGLAYAAPDGVYFSVRSLPTYGALSGRKLDDLEAGARVEVDEQKRDPMDFALWKLKKPGEPFWPSPWGDGRPGWHIECSAMSMRYLGHTIDIHAGGSDLVFPHHENERAQSEGATGHEFVRYWMHVGFINIDDKKMSKSLDNFFTARDIISQFDPEAVRLFLISAHYRSPINFSRELIQAATAAMTRLRNARDSFKTIAETGLNEPLSAELEAFISALPTWRDRFCTAMDDDFNTADALGVIYELLRDANRLLSQQPVRSAAQSVSDIFLELTAALGIFFKTDEAIPAEVLDMAAARQQARAAKNFAEADRLRAAISELGYILEDTPQGPVVKRK